MIITQTALTAQNLTSTLSGMWLPTIANTMAPMLLSRPSTSLELRRATTQSGERSCHLNDRNKLLHAPHPPRNPNAYHIFPARGKRPLLFQG